VVPVGDPHAMSGQDLPRPIILARVEHGHVQVDALRLEAPQRGLEELDVLPDRNRDAERESGRQGPKRTL
jgi:hypothetical protein